MLRESGRSVELQNVFLKEFHLSVTDKMLEAGDADKAHV